MDKKLINALTDQSGIASFLPSLFAVHLALARSAHVHLLPVFDVKTYAVTLNQQ